GRPRRRTTPRCGSTSARGRGREGRRRRSGRCRLLARWRRDVVADGTRSAGTCARNRSFPVAPAGATRTSRTSPALPPVRRRVGARDEVRDVLALVGPDVDGPGRGAVRVVVEADV